MVVLEDENPEDVVVVEEDLVRLEGSGRLLRRLENILCGWMITGLLRWCSEESRNIGH